jgi:hypothetical protein
LSLPFFYVFDFRGKWQISTQAFQEGFCPFFLVEVGGAVDLGGRAVPPGLKNVSKILSHSTQ